jgi:magnesium transporter
MAYPEETAGRLMDADIITIRPDVTVDVVLRYLRRHETIPRHTDALMVVDETNTFLGTLPLSRLLTAQPGLSVSDLIDTDADRVPVDMSDHDVAQLFERHDLISVAVVDAANKLLGRITIDEVVNIIHEEANQTLLNMAGLDQEDDLFAPVLPSALRRAFWLGLNLATAFLAAWVIGRFEATLEKVVALAVLMPVVASRGGIAGSQTLTLMIRGLALGQISGSNARWLAFKELAVGALNGVIWAIVVAAVAILWFGDWRIGAIIAVAMVINLLAAAFSGIAIPLLLHKLKLDPALSGSVVLTTITDVVGFMSFLGLGTLFLM